MSAYKNVTHVIFDMDGLLLDTERIYSEVTQNILNEYGNGQIYTYAVKASLMGFQSAEVADRIIGEYNLPLQRDEYTALTRTKPHTDLFREAQLLPGAARLIRHLNKNNIPFALATSSSLEMATIKMTNHLELFDLFDHKVMGSSDPEVINGKPAPDIFLVAARRFPDNPKPEQCLVFEDAPNGVRAATLAGMQSVMVPDPQVAAELRTEATIILNSLLEFKPELFGLPPFEDSPVNSESDDSADK